MAKIELAKKYIAEAKDRDDFLSAVLGVVAFGDELAVLPQREIDRLAMSKIEQLGLPAPLIEYDEFEENK